MKCTILVNISKSNMNYYCPLLHSSIAPELTLLAMYLHTKNYLFLVKPVIQVSHLKWVILSIAQLQVFYRKGDKYYLVSNFMYCVSSCKYCLTSVYLRGKGKVFLSATQVTSSTAYFLRNSAEKQTVLPHFTS